MTEQGVDMCVSVCIAEGKVRLYSYNEPWGNIWICIGHLLHIIVAQVSISPIFLCICDEKTDRHDMID